MHQVRTSASGICQLGFCQRRHDKLGVESQSSPKVDAVFTRIPKNFFSLRSLSTSVGRRRLWRPGPILPSAQKWPGGGTVHRLNLFEGWSGDPPTAGFSDRTGLRQGRSRLGAQRGASVSRRACVRSGTAFWASAFIGGRGSLTRGGPWLALLRPTPATAARRPRSSPAPPVSSGVSKFPTSEKRKKSRPGGRGSRA